MPTLACCGPERVPVGRINKFRAIFGQVFPSLAEAHKCGAVCFAMAKWVLAINSAFPTQRNSTVSSHTATKEMSVKSRPTPAGNPLKSGAARVPSPEKAAASQAATERAAASIDPTFTPADLRKMLS